jgi:hypothetical protein
VSSKPPNPKATAEAATGGLDTVDGLDSAAGGAGSGASLTSGAIAGIAIGTVLGAGLLCCAAVCCLTCNCRVGRLEVSLRTGKGSSSSTGGAEYGAGSLNASETRARAGNGRAAAAPRVSGGAAAGRVIRTGGGVGPGRGRRPGASAPLATADANGSINAAPLPPPGVRRPAPASQGSLDVISDVE